MENQSFAKERSIVPKSGFWWDSTPGPIDECVSAQPTELHRCFATRARPAGMPSLGSYREAYRLSTDWILTRHPIHSNLQGAYHLNGKIRSYHRIGGGTCYGFTYTTSIYSPCRRVLRSYTSLAIDRLKTPRSAVPRLDGYDRQTNRQHDRGTPPVRSADLRYGFTTSGEHGKRGGCAVCVRGCEGPREIEVGRAWMMR